MRDRVNSSEIGRTVLADLRKADLHRSMWRDLRDLYDFYLDEEERERLAQMNEVERWGSTVGWLLKRLVLSLSGARRLLLLVAFVALGWGLVERQLAVLTAAFLVLLLILMFELRDKLLARDELEVGRAVQLALLPTDNPELGGWDIWLYSRPANDVGGDVVDYLHLDDTRLGLALGDVAGKALGAALLAAKLQSTLRAWATEAGSVVELAERTNRIFCRDGLPNRFATLIYVELTAGDGHIRVLNAGHMPPVALLGGRLGTLDPVALPLGIMPEAKYREQSLSLQPDDLVVLYSDGLSEAMLGDEEFGDERVRQQIAMAGGLTAEQLGRRLLDAVDSFTGEVRPHDDLSLAILRRTG